ncbi:MAG TPA: protoporphyrinogen oxidase HemJ [Gammaproteobacteria bacterium]|nr:protoporphyrinogen oxidase HemJ [Gammaproteobacteria bacterium]
MLWIKAIHLIALVAWFSGLFYLPRLFIYHSKWKDPISDQHFKIMEKKLYYYITTPAGILTLIFGFWIMSYNFAGYLQEPWMHLKLSLVALLIIYHLYLGRVVKQFQNNQNQHKIGFYHFLHSLPSLFLIIIVILAVVKPGGIIS